MNTPVKPIIRIATFLLFSLSAAGASEEDKVRGVFSNSAEGFYTTTLMVHESGYAYFHASVAGVIGQWSYDKAASVLHFDCFDPGSNKDASIDFLFDADRRCFTGAGGGFDKQSDATKTLRYMTNEIPDQLVQAFKTYPEELKKHRRQLELREQQKRNGEEKLAREKPEYETIRKAIAENPCIVVSQEFYVRDDTPATRALKSTLGDREIEFPEDVLIDLLEELPPDNHWIRKLVFARLELSASTIEKFYSKALDWGAHLNYGILANIAKHPNAPMRLVEDLATRRDLPGGATRPAQEQMENYAQKVLAERSGVSQETFRHLYEVALRIPKAGHTDTGKAIILALAKSSTTPTNILVEIADTDDQLVQSAIVLNTNTPMTTLTRLSTSRFSEVRADVGRHPDIPVTTLLALSEDKEGCVRAAVAAHPGTPSTKLIEMQADKYFDVKRNLVKNPNTPDAVLRKLAADRYAIINSEAQKALRIRDIQNKAASDKGD